MGAFDLRNPAFAYDAVTDGGVASLKAVQRFKAGFGANNSYSDVSTSVPLPVRGSPVIVGTQTVSAVNGYSGVSFTIPTAAAASFGGFILIAVTGLTFGNGNGQLRIQFLDASSHPIDLPNSGSTYTNINYPFFNGAETWTVTSDVPVGAVSMSLSNYGSTNGVNFTVTFFAGGNYIGGTVNVNGSVAVSSAVSLQNLPSAGLYSYTPYRITSAASNNSQSVKNYGPGKLLRIVLVNSATLVRWIKFYDTASAPTPGTNTVLFTLPIPANGALDLDFSVLGVQFTNGIGITIGVNNTDSDNTNFPNAGDVVGFLMVV